MVEGGLAWQTPWIGSPCSKRMSGLSDWCCLGLPLSSWWPAKKNNHLLRSRFLTIGSPFRITAWLHGNFTFCYLVSGILRTKWSITCSIFLHFLPWFLRSPVLMIEVLMIFLVSRLLENVPKHCTKTVSARRHLPDFCSWSDDPTLLF